MDINEQDKLAIKLIREQGRSGANIDKAFDLYNRYNTYKVRKKWCGGCSNRVYDWINTVAI